MSSRKVQVRPWPRMPRSCNRHWHSTSKASQAGPALHPALQGLLQVPLLRFLAMFFRGTAHCGLHKTHCYVAIQVLSTFPDKKCLHIVGKVQCVCKRALHHAEAMLGAEQVSVTNTSQPLVVVDTSAASARPTDTALPSACLPSNPAATTVPRLCRALNHIVHWFHRFAGSEPLCCNIAVVDLCVAFSLMLLL